MGALTVEERAETAVMEVLMVTVEERVTMSREAAKTVVGWPVQENRLMVMGVEERAAVMVSRMVHSTVAGMLKHSVTLTPVTRNTTPVRRLARNLARATETAVLTMSALITLITKVGVARHRS